MKLLSVNLASDTSLQTGGIGEEANLGGFAGSDIIPVIRICDPGFSTVKIFNREFTFTLQFGEFRFEVFNYEWINEFGRLVWDKSVVQTHG